MNDGGRYSHISVRVLNGVSGEEEARFPINTQASNSEHHFLEMLDRLCQQQIGHNLSRLHWLSQAKAGDRFQRRACDIKMVDEIVGEHSPVLLLCTIPAPPPSEMP